MRTKSALVLSIGDTVAQWIVLVGLIAILSINVWAGVLLVSQWLAALH